MTPGPWRLTLHTPPPENVELDTKIEDADGERNHQRMTFHSNLWWISDDMYAYYHPTHWRTP